MIPISLLDSSSIVSPSPPRQYPRRAHQSATSDVSSSNKDFQDDDLSWAGSPTQNESTSEESSSFIAAEEECSALQEDIALLQQLLEFQYHNTLNQHPACDKEEALNESSGSLMDGPMPPLWPPLVVAPVKSRQNSSRSIHSSRQNSSRSIPGNAMSSRQNSFRSVQSKRSSSSLDAASAAASAAAVKVQSAARGWLCRLRFRIATLERRLDEIETSKRRDLWLVEEARQNEMKIIARQSDVDRVLEEQSRQIRQAEKVIAELMSNLAELVRENEELSRKTFELVQQHRELTQWYAYIDKLRRENEEWSEVSERLRASVHKYEQALDERVHYAEAEKLIRRTYQDAIDEITELVFCHAEDGDFVSDPYAMRSKIC